MKTVVISSYYGCQGLFFKKLFENYKSLVSVVEKEEWSFVFSSNLKGTLKELGADVSCVSFLYHPYRIIEKLSDFHLSLKDRDLTNLNSSLREHVKKIKSLSGRKLLFEEIFFSKKRLKTIYNDLLIESNFCFEIEEFFSDPEKSCVDLASCVGLSSKLLLESFNRVGFSPWEKLDPSKIKEEDLRKSYLDLKKEINSQFLEKFLLAKSKVFKREKVIPKEKEFLLENFQQELLCSEDLPDKVIFGMKELDKQRNVCLKGWYLSPYLGSYLEFKWSNGEVSFIFNFGVRKEVDELYREYNQNWKSFYFKKKIPENVYSLDVSSMMQGKVRAKKSFVILNKKIREICIVEQSLLNKESNSNKMINFHKKLSEISELQGQKILNFRYLLVCRPFKLLEKQSFKEKNLFFCFADKNSVASLQLHTIKDFYASVFIETSLFSELPRLQKKFVEESKNISIVEDLTYLDCSSSQAPKIAFLLSSDTHVSFMKKLISSVSSRLCIVPDPKNKEEGAIQRLNEIAENYITFGYKQTVCEELKEFKPDYVVSLTDWTSEYLALQKFFEGSKTKFITIQEGPHDWDMQFMRNRELYVSNQYRNSDIFISQGPDPLRHIQPRFFSILGTPKIVYEEKPLVQEFLIIINCNFTYEKTKPEYETNRDYWLSSVISICKKNGFAYQILQHPRDFSNIDDPNTVKTNASIVKEYIEKAAVVVSRFSSISLEALALNRNSIYYNPHREPMLSFNDQNGGALLVSYDEESLEKSLKKIYANFSLKKENLFSFEQHIETLNFYVNNQGNTSSDRICSFLKKANQFYLDEDRFENLLKETRIQKISSSPRESFKKKYFLIFSMDSVETYKEENLELYMLGYQLCCSGHKVYYYTDEIPGFLKELRTIVPLDDFHLVLSKSHSNNKPVGPIDVILFPSYFSDEKASFFKKEAFGLNHIAMT
jgi:hypothetical protein